jgi:hypothetical protein
MPPLIDAIVLAQFEAVLANWNFTGYVTAKDMVLDWIAKELGGLNLKDIAKAMHDHVRSGGTIEQIRETRPEWSIWPFHYDLRLQLAGRNLYFETILQDDNPKDPTVHIVSIHDV